MLDEPVLDDLFLLAFLLLFFQCFLLSSSLLVNFHGHVQTYTQQTADEAAQSDERCKYDGQFLGQHTPTT